MGPCAILQSWTKQTKSNLISYNIKIRHQTLKRNQLTIWLSISYDMPYVSYDMMYGCFDTQQTPYISKAQISDDIVWISYDT